MIIGLNKTNLEHLQKPQNRGMTIIIGSNLRRIKIENMLEATVHVLNRELNLTHVY